MSTTYERAEFDADGMQIICTYQHGLPYTPIACRPGNKPSEWVGDGKAWEAEGADAYDSALEANPYTAGSTANLFWQGGWENRRRQMVANHLGYEAGVAGHSSACPFSLADQKAEFNAWLAGHEQGIDARRAIRVHGI